MSDAISIERRDDGVAILRIDRPPVNAISTAVATELRDGADKLAGDPSVKAVVVTGSPKAFAAGADVSEFEEKDGVWRLPTAVKQAGHAISAIPRPVIAAIAGYALGAGLELSMACDLRVAAENARLGQPEILLGIFPGASGTQRLPRLIGPARAKEMIFSGRQVTAQEALAIGLVDRVVPAAELLDAATAWAAELAKGAVVAMGLAKSAINQGLDRSLMAGIDVETECFAEAFQTEDARLGIRSFFENGPGKAPFVGR